MKTDLTIFTALVVFLGVIIIYLIHKYDEDFEHKSSKIIGFIAFFSILIAGTFFYFTISE